MQRMVDDDIDTSKAVVAVMAVMGWVGPLMVRFWFDRRILGRRQSKVDNVKDTPKCSFRWSGAIVNAETAVRWR